MLFSLFEEREVLVRNLVFVAHVIFTKFQEVDTRSALGTLITFLLTVKRANFTDAYFIKCPAGLDHVLASFLTAQISSDHLTSSHVVVLKVILIDLEMFKRAGKFWLNCTIIRCIVLL